MTLNESNRTRLIGEIANVLREQSVPPETHAAGLTLIGWLARRLPEEGAGGGPRDHTPSPGASRPPLSE